MISRHPPDAAAVSKTLSGVFLRRHTFARMMIAAGVNATALSTYMRHAGVSITYDRYGHLTPGSEAEAAGLLDAYFDQAVGY